MRYTFQGKTPIVAKEAWIAQSAQVIGQVKIASNASIFFQCVIRGDNDLISIGANTNVQDGCILHSDPQHTLWIGDNVTIGHGCILHGCHIENECLIGMGTTILNDVHIGEHCIIGAGTLLLEHTNIPPNSVVVGSPGKIVKSITIEQINDIIINSEHYKELAKEYKEAEENQWMNMEQR